MDGVVTLNYKFLFFHPSWICAFCHVTEQFLLQMPQCTLLLLDYGLGISLVSANGMWAGEAVYHAWVSGPQQVFASPFASLLSPRGELLLGSCCSLTWTQGRAHRADQSPNCNQVPRPPSQIWNLMQSPSRAWPRSAHSTGPTQKLLAEFLSRRIWQYLKLLCVCTRRRDCNLSPQIHFSLISLGTWLANISQPSLHLDVANVRWSNIYAICRPGLSRKLEWFLHTLPFYQLDNSVMRF